MADNPDACRWFDYAEEDWAYGNPGLSRFPRAAAWSFQQAAEKALKACLINTGVVPPRTHDLVLLLNLQVTSGAADLREAVLLLAEISTAARYPDDAEPVSEALARDYGIAVRSVIDHACGVIKGGR